MSRKVYALVPFKYDRPDYQLDRGEIFTTKDLPNDAKLEGLKYLAPFTKGEHKEISCDNCSRLFVNQDYMHAHKAKRGGCMSQSQEISNAEFAEMTGRDLRHIKIEDSLIEPPM